MSPCPLATGTILTSTSTRGRLCNMKPKPLAPLTQHQDSRSSAQQAYCLPKA